MSSKEIRPSPFTVMSHLRRLEIISAGRFYKYFAPTVLGGWANHPCLPKKVTLLDRAVESGAGARALQDARAFAEVPDSRSVLDCGGPPPLWNDAYQGIRFYWTGPAAAP